MRKIDNLTDELEIFKTKINLVEYAQAQGYTVNLSKSAHNSVFLVNNTDKIVIATATITPPTFSNRQHINYNIGVRAFQQLFTRLSQP